MRKTLIALALSMSAAAAGCAPTMAPLFAPTETAGVSAGGTPYTATQIDQAVVAGAQAKGWTVVQHNPGLTVAEVAAAGHSARVRILTNESGWKIVHEQSSPGLKYGHDDSHGEVIHRRYNHWVRLLDESIRQQLGKTTAPTVEPGVGGAALEAAAPAAPIPTP